MTDVQAEQPEPDDYACERVRRALAADPLVGELGIAVRVAGRRVFLSGDVATPERQQAVADVVAAVLPGHEVRNDVQVTPVAGGPGIETLA